MTLIDPPGRQGPGPLANEAVARLDLGIARRAGGPLPGERRAPGVGAGTELAQLRPYEPGDDPRQIDPAASARTGVPHVRQHVPERALTTWIVLDLSASMAFGTGLRLKSRRRRGRRRRRSGSSRSAAAAGSRSSPPARPRARRCRRAPAAARSPPCAGWSAPASRRTRPPPSCRSPPRSSASRRLARTRGLVTVVSDFRDDGWQAPLRTLAQRHTVDRDRDQRPARGRAARRRPARARRPRDRRDRRGRHRLAAHPRRLRRRRGRAPRRRSPARSAAPAPTT